MLDLALTGFIALLLALGQLVLRMTLQTGVMDLLDAVLPQRPHRQRRGFGHQPGRINGRAPWQPTSSS